MSFNVRVWTRDTDKSKPGFWKTRMERACQMVESYKPDILCLQECWPPVTQMFERIGYKKVSCLTHHIIFVRNGSTFKVKGRGFKIHEDWIDLTNGWRIINVHSRWDDKTRRKNIAEINKLVEGRKAIACGDFNNDLRTLVNDGLNLTSVRAVLNLPEEDTFENWTRPTESHGEIDHFMINKALPNFTNYQVIKEAPGEERWSDHWPIMMTFREYLVL